MATSEVVAHDQGDARFERLITVYEVCNTLGGKSWQSQAPASAKRPTLPHSRVALNGYGDRDATARSLLSSACLEDYFKPSTS